MNIMNLIKEAQLEKIKITGTKIIQERIQEKRKELDSMLKCNDVNMDLVFCINKGIEDLIKLLGKIQGARTFDEICYLEIPDTLVKKFKKELVKYV